MLPNGKTTVRYQGQELYLDIPQGAGDAEILSFLSKTYPELDGGTLSRNADGVVLPRAAAAKAGCN